MPIVSTVEAKSWKGRLFHSGILLVLTIGGLTMVYPFVIMISGSLRSPMDQSEMSVVPAYFYDSPTLYQKFLERKYNESIASLSQVYQHAYFDFDVVEVSEHSLRDAYADAMAAYLGQEDMPRHWLVFGGMYSRQGVPPNLRVLRHHLKEKYDADLYEFSRALGTAADSWLGVTASPPRWVQQRFGYEDNVIWQTYFEMASEAPPAELFPVSITGYFLETMVYPVHGSNNLESFNEAYNTRYESFRDFQLPRTLPPADSDQSSLRDVWREFVLRELNPSFVVVTQAESDDYRAFLIEQYETIESLNKTWGGDYRRFDDLALTDGRRWLTGGERQDYQRFLQDVPIENLLIVGPEYDWPTWAVEHGQLSIDDADAVLPMNLAVAAMEYRYTLEHAGSLRWQFAIANYITVWEELVLEGRALINTIIFCLMSIVLALLINPLAAYGLSRFKPPGTFKILLILMATVAFPPMVTLIPQFILLRELGLMNTFIALVIPMIANGYMIFLLKGFFDSLPKELYEAARIDGASEMRIFFQFAMALSKPILAVLALNTFTAAYAAFLYPLLVAPDPQMWLISVWLYQFQQRASSSAVYASVIIASIPTLVIFLLVQRTIMRGIVVPTEK